MKLRPISTPLYEVTGLRTAGQSSAFDETYRDGDTYGDGDGAFFVPGHRRSRQSVRTFVPVIQGDLVHPDALEYFHPDELAEVIDEASPITFSSLSDVRHVSYIENSQYDGLVAFQSDSQEKAELAYIARIEARAKKRQRRADAAAGKIAVSIAPDIDADERAMAIERYKERARTEARRIISRWQDGFHLDRATEVAGEVVAPFSEVLGKNVLRGHLSPSLGRIAQLLPKAGRLRVGMDKAVLQETTSKVLALDAPYIEMDPTRLGAIIVELDTVWTSANALRAALLTILPQKMMPQIASARTTPDGLFKKAHLIWLLNPAYVDADGVVRDATVWNDPVRTITDKDGNEKTVGDIRCKMAPIRKFRAVQRSMVALLAPLGADPACHNINRPKSPLSPFLSAVLMNEDHWPILDDFEQIPGYCKKVDEEALEEMATKMRLESEGIEPRTSNLVWKVVQNIIKPLARLALKTREADFLTAARSDATLAAWFDAQVRPIAVDTMGEPSEVLDRVLARQCEFAARWCRRRKVGRRGPSRGRDRDLITATVETADGGERNLTTAERATQTAERTNTHRTAVAMHRLGKEMVVAIWTTGEIRITAFIKNLDTVGKSFAYDHWDEMCERLNLVETDKGVFRRAAPKIKRSPYLGKNIESSLPAPAIQPPVSVAECLRPTGFQFDTSDPHPEHHRPPVNRANLGSPPGPEPVNRAQLSAEPCPTSDLRLPEPA